MTNLHRIELLHCEENSPYLAQLDQLFQSEWSDFRLCDAYTKNANLPPVLVAVVDDVVIGGLAYSRFKEPHRNGEVIWVNAVFVSVEHRNKGIASQLINAGVSQTLESSQDYLYVYTNVPKLYQSLGWSEVDIESEPDHKVMRISLKSRLPV
ncbi:GNAT family N-acetyltransferase [Aeromonas sp. sif2416]|uniref:GNAT family N-acetyltransferase n=1 Tax=Aeromonas sp. sif2416 TaxID=2854793 RepID=UPI001C457798|nr:GNAT family N-acetyltransferase [Aeromonas sp. sif2416]MBV7439174.1 GNAT family N-acetyltransferase [Aeromonas sp. sif2416]